MILQILLVILPGEPFEVLAGMCYGVWGGTLFVTISVFTNNGKGATNKILRPDLIPVVGGSNVKYSYTLEETMLDELKKADTEKARAAVKSGATTRTKKKLSQAQKPRSAKKSDKVASPTKMPHQHKKHL